MAVTEDRSKAFGVTKQTSRTRRASMAKRRKTFQFNSFMTEGLKPHIKFAAAQEGKSLGDLVEPIIVEYLIKNGYMSSEEATKIGALRGAEKEA